VHLQNLDSNSETQFYHGYNLVEKERIGEGLKYILEAAKQKNAQACFFLADCYQYGEYGFESNIDKALSLYIDACKHGEKFACRNLYRLLKKRHGKLKAANIISQNFSLGSFSLRIFCPIESLCAWLEKRS